MTDAPFHLPVRGLFLYDESRIAVVCSTDWQNSTGLRQAVLIIAEGRLGARFSKLAVYTGSLPSAIIGQGGSGGEAKDDDHKG